MRQQTGVVENRRRFLRFLACSPLLAMGSLGSTPELLGRLIQNPELITRSEDAINVFDFEAVAQRTIPPAHFGYMATGVAFAARATAISPSGWKAFWLPTGQRMIGLFRLSPK